MKVARRIWTMLRYTSLAVLAFLTALPATAGQPACPDGSLAAIFETPAKTGEEAAFPAQEEPQNKACIFVCDPWYQTPMYRGSGVDCTAAQNSLASQVSSYAAANGVSLCNAGGALGYCGYTVHVTVTCHWDFVLGAYSKDGYGDIKCRDYC